VDAQGVRITVNGQERDVPQGTSVAGLLSLMGVEKGRVAVEKNRDVVTKQAYDTAILQAGDHLEIVAFVGGGL
jgi:thiamine biosynthesis protein ThiS